MIKIKKSVIIFILFIILAVLSCRSFVYADDPVSTPAPTSIPAQTPAPTAQASDNSQQITDLNKKIGDLEKKVSDLQSTENTLSSQIDVMDNQISLTEYRINSVKQQIADTTADITVASKNITHLEGSLNDVSKVLINRIKATYQAGDIDPVHVLLSSTNLQEYISRENYLKIVQEHDQELIYNTQQAKIDYANQKAILESKRKKIVALQTQLEDFTTQLDQEKKNKEDLLSQTQGSEENYQQMISAAKAQLASLANFATSRVGTGGSTIPHSDLSDSWGKYYNQRDANWGKNYIGASSEQIWEVGCLMTSYAMVSTHLGTSVTPADVAANTDNFSLGTAYFKLPGPAPAGHSADYEANPSMSLLQDKVKAGFPVIAGMSSNGGPYPQHYSDHWVVLRGVNGDGSFQINDPWYDGAMNVNINDHYSGWAIIEARIYN